MIRTAALFWLVLATPLVAQPVTFVLEPAQEAELKTTVNGRLQDVSVTLGQKVKKGDVVAKIDARVQTARVDLAKVVAEATGGEIRSSKVMEQATSRLELIRKARERGAAQVWEVEAAEQALAVAEADLLLATEDRIRKEAELALETATLDEFSLRAPFDGTILDVLAEEGEVVQTETTVIVIGQLVSLEGTAFFPVDWVQDLEPGAELAADAETGGRFPIRVTAIDPRIDPASATVRMVFEVANTDGDLRAGTRMSIDRP